MSEDIIQEIGKYQIKWDGTQCFARIKGTTEWIEIKQGESFEKLEVK